jgi:protein-L-isoaspartate(D-aspartate) O-methyltransferase
MALALRPDGSTNMNSHASKIPPTAPADDVGGLEQGGKVPERGDTGQPRPFRIVAHVGLIAAAVFALAWAAWFSWPLLRGSPPHRKSPRAVTDNEASRASEREDERRRMVDKQLHERGIASREVLAAFERVERHRFVPTDLSELAYADRPLPIGHEQTISQPYVVALMTELARPKRNARALDVGTGSGYQAAVLAELCDEVYGIEIVRPLADAASKRLADLGYDNVEIRCGDGYRGWPEHAPFDVIILAAAPDHVPQALIDQLAPGGRLVLPVGRTFQQITIVEKQADGTTRKWTAEAVSFVPMTGEAQEKRSSVEK